jgi:hypothetical protein
MRQKLQDIKDYFNPRQKWLTQVIPNHWCDKVELIPHLLFTCLINFVESENGLGQLDYDWAEELKAGDISEEYLESIYSSYKELKAAYTYIKHDRPQLVKAFVDSYEEHYRNTHRLEKDLKDKDQEAMMLIVKHRQIMWT